MRISDWSSDVCSSDLTFTRLRVDFDPPTMVLDDAEHDRHSQTRTLSDRLGREERFEHMLQRRLVHAATVITNRDFDEINALARTQRDRAGALDRLSGIVEDVDAHLLELRRREQHRIAFDKILP